MIQTATKTTPEMARRFRPRRLPVSLRQQFPLASFVGCADVQVEEATEFSGKCRAGQLFAAIRGTKCDGHDFAAAAVANGAAALLVERPLADVLVPQCIVRDTRTAYARLCSALEGHPSHFVSVAGITGTNGKTTVSWLIRSILHASGRQAGLLGTIEYDDGSEIASSQLTTPDSKTLAHWLGRMARNHTDFAAIELSSHALDQQRAAGTSLHTAVITNITQDHFDYHKQYNAYLAAKARIAEHLRPGGSVLINADDAGCRAVRQELGSDVNILSYGLASDADVRGKVMDESPQETHFLLQLPDVTEPIEVQTPLIGRHNIANCLAAAAVCRQFDLSVEDIVEGIRRLDCVPGRLQRIDCGQPFDVFVDYAHTDDALRNAVDCLQRLTHGRVICVFGAGGDRDRTKRPLLGRAASAAEFAVVTSDNPRTEDPQQIIADIIPGFTSPATHRHIEADRERAIAFALSIAEPGDCVLVAGKGHEAVQIVGAERIPFDDCEVVRRKLIQPASHSPPHCDPKPA